MQTNFDIFGVQNMESFSIPTYLSPYQLQIKFSMSLFFYLFTIVINLWHEKFVKADVIAVFVNKQHGIQPVSIHI